MTAVSWISFGPDLEPLEIDARRLASPPGPRPDGLLVAGDADEVADVLARACASPEGWCRLESVGSNGGRHAVHVQARLVRFVVPGNTGDATTRVSSST
jgi:hypothetical protein